MSSEADKKARVRMGLSKAAETLDTLAGTVKCPAQRAQFKAKAAALKARANNFGRSV